MAINVFTDTGSVKVVVNPNPKVDVGPDVTKATPAPPTPFHPLPRMGLLCCGNGRQPMILVALIAIHR